MAGSWIASKANKPKAASSGQPVEEVTTVVVVFLVVRWFYNLLIYLSKVTSLTHAHPPNYLLFLSFILLYAEVRAAPQVVLIFFLVLNSKLISTTILLLDEISPSDECVLVAK